MPFQKLQLEAKQTMSQVLAPQLRQSLEMLQLPIIELRTLIQNELEQNPTIEEIVSDGPTIEVEPEPGESEATSEELDFDRELDDLTAIDDEWREYFLQNARNQPYSPEDEEKRQYLFDTLQQTESLQERLLMQLHLTDLNPEDMRIGEMIVGSIDDDGYIRPEAWDFPDAIGLDAERMQDVLALIQGFDPPGIGARDLKECLLIQLEHAGRQNSLEARIVEEHLGLLGKRKLQDIARLLKRRIEEVRAAAEAIARLDPKPGRVYSAAEPRYVLPEVIVEKIDGKYVVVVNNEQLPRIRLNRQYMRMMKDKSINKDVRQYIRERMKASVFLLKSVNQRQRTIYRVAQEIVTAQTGFLDNGVSQLKPMTMAEVARRLEIHETTVSRAVSGKYMKTPSGLFDMKHFFTPGLKTSTGEEISNKAVRNLIAQIVAQENGDKPLSDQAIVEKVRESGVNIARRTVAKYRLILKIQPSHMRKRL